MGFEELETKLSENLDGDSSDDDSSDEQDYPERPCANLSPTVCIGFDSIEELFWTGQVTDNDGNPVEHQNYGDTGLVLRNPTVVKGTVFESSAREDHDLSRHSDDGPYVDFRICDPEDFSFEENYDSNGDVKSVTSGNRDAFDTMGATDELPDELTLFVGGVAGDSIMKALDVNGRPGAMINSDGEHTFGLIEWNPDAGEDDARTRVSRYPHLRDIDWDGESEGVEEARSDSDARQTESDGGFLYLTRRASIDAEYDGNAFWAVVGHNDFEGDNIQDATFIEPQMDREAAQDALTNDEGSTYVPAFAWHEQDVSTSDGSEAEDEDTSEFDFGDDDRESEESELGETAQQFAEGAANHLDAGATADDAWDDFAAMVENNMEKSGGDLPNDVDVDALKAEIDAQAASA